MPEFCMAGLSTNAGGQLQDFLQNIPTDRTEKIIILRTEKIITHKYGKRLILQGWLRTEKIITHNFIFAQACPHEESRTAFAVRLSWALPLQRD
jgi:hypothetical protein